MHHLILFIGAMGLKGILVLVLSILVIVFILKQLFKVAIILAIVAVLLHFGLPILNTILHGIR
ncbi:MAG: hypothetical protein ACYCVD_19380 [Desulfitobacteriaceae bacterium]